MVGKAKPGGKPALGKWIAAAILVLAIGGGAIWFSGADSQECAVEGPLFADAGDAELVVLGRTVYGENCAGCHGDRLQGQPNWRRRLPGGAFPAPPHDASGHTWHHPDRFLFSVTKCGGAAAAPEGFVSAMPEFTGVLGDREILASLAFIKSRWPDDIRRRQEMISRQNP